MFIYPSFFPRTLAACVLLWAPALLLAEEREGGIPWESIGQEAAKSGAGEGVDISPAPGGARLRAVFQQLEGVASADGLWLRSTDPDEVGKSERFRVMAAAVGRGESGAPLPGAGQVSIGAGEVMFSRPGLTEEYRVSVDGLRQDFVVPRRPDGDGELSVALTVSGAAATAAGYGALLTVTGSGREIAYSRLLVSDAAGRSLPARLEVTAADSLRVRVDDTSAVYPVRIDPTFSDADWITLNPSVPGVDGSVTAAVTDDAGNLYIGGSFAHAGPVACNNVAKWDGARWSALGEGTSSTVTALAVQGQSLYATGEFGQAGGVSALRIAKWKNGAWSALGSGLDHVGHALLVQGDEVYVGGQFSTAGGVAARGIARWSDGTWSGLGEGSNESGRVLALTAVGNNVYAGGDFHTMDGVPAPGVAMWDGSAWSALGAGVSGTVMALREHEGVLYAGGSLSRGESYIGHVAAWNGSTWSGLAAGMPEYARVRTLLVVGGELHAGGYTAVGLSGANLVKWTGGTWATVDSGTNGEVLTLAFHGGTLYAGGWFTRVNGVAADRVAKRSGNTWSAFTPGMNGQVRALAVSGSSVYVAGDFSNAGNVAASRVVQWTGTDWVSLGAGMDNSVYALAVGGGNLYAGGSFYRADGKPVNGVAKWNGSAWSALGTGVGGGVSTVAALATDGNDLYAGGYFTTAGGSPARTVAKWNGSAWSALGNGIPGAKTVQALVVSAGTLYAGGSFLTASGGRANCVAQWNGATWSPVGDGPRNTVTALAVDNGSLYVGGAFDESDGFAANHIARWNGSQWSRLGTGIENCIRVNALLFSGNELFVGGAFRYPDYPWDRGMVKWDGRTWSIPGSGTDGEVRALAVNASHQLFAGGAFTTAGASYSPYLAQANLPTGPEIALFADSGAVELSSGQSGVIDFGIIAPGEAATRSFLLGNDGRSALSLSGLTLPPGYELTGAALPASLAANTNIVLQLRFTGGLAPGDYRGLLALASDDADEPVFTVPLFGQKRSAMVAPPLDSTFGGSGKVTTALGNGDAVGRAVALQSDGKILVAGSVHNGTDNDFVLTRYTATGQVDTSFGVGGTVTTDFADFDDSDDLAMGVAVRSDGKVLVAGQATHILDAEPRETDFAVARYTAEGALDSSFGLLGKIKEPVGAFVGGVRFGGFTLQSDGKVLMTGTDNSSLVVVRLNENGTADDGFGRSGHTTLILGGFGSVVNGEAVTVQGDGKIVVAGTFKESRSRFAVARLTENGSTEWGFGQQAWVVTDIGSGDAFARGVAVQKNGNIVVAGYCVDGGGDTDFVVARYTPEGALDLGFGTRGLLTSPIGAAADYGVALALREEDGIVVAGHARNGANDDFAVASFRGPGVPDAGFGGTGKALTPIGAGEDQGHAVAVQSDGRILVAGSAHDGTRRVFALARYVAGPEATVITGAAVGTGETAATLHGTANPNGAVTDVWFEYGLTPAYGAETLRQPIGYAGAEQPLSAALDGLDPGTVYHYRLVARNASTTVRGGDMTFATTGTLTPQQAWRRRFFGSIANTGNAADTSDFDGDGIPNLLEWACGSSPVAMDPPPVSASVTGTGSTRAIEFLYTESMEALAAGTDHVVEWTDTLSAPDSWRTAGVTGSVLSENGGLRRMRALIPAEGQPQRFVRLKVTSPE